MLVAKFETVNKVELQVLVRGCAGFIEVFNYFMLILRFAEFACNSSTICQVAFPCRIQVFI